MKTLSVTDMRATVINFPFLEPLTMGRLDRAKAAYTTRRVALDRAVSLITTGEKPRSGDLVLARIEELGQHENIERVDGRRARLHPGDEIIVCYGNRYAPDQFEAEVPEDLGPCHLVAAGGVASRCLRRHSKVRKATRIKPIGLLADASGEPLNLSNFGIVRQKAPMQRPPVIAVIGTTMNAGKTTTASHVILGMSRQGLKVGAAKVTGTGAGGDRWSMVDAGSHVVLDFTDCGVPSTYKLPVDEVIGIMETLVAELAAADVDRIVLEVADGVLQTETRALVQSAPFASLVEGVVFAAGDALGALAGVSWLREKGVPVFGISGVLTASPLAHREAEEAVGLPVLNLVTLGDGDWLPECLAASRTKKSEDRGPTSPALMTAAQ